MRLHTWSARGAAVLVAVIAGAASWEHIASVAYGAGERAWVAYSLPAAIDGLIIVGVAAMLEDRQTGARSRWRARLAVVTGVVATLAANVASAEPTWTARLVAVAAPVSFLLSVEVLTRSSRPVPPAPAGSRDPAAAGTRRRAAGKRTAAEKVAAARQRHPDATQGEIASRTRLGVRTVARHWRASGPDTTPATEHPDGHANRVPVLADSSADRPG